MRTARVRGSQVVEGVAAVQPGVDVVSGRCWPDGLTEADVDRLLDEVDRDLAATRAVEGARLLLDHRNVRRPRRARRRAEREVLRSLPGRISVGDVVEDGVA